MEKIARLLEFIKYVTLRKTLNVQPNNGIIIFSINTNVDEYEYAKNIYVQMSNNSSFNFESIVIDYGSDYSKSLKEREQKINFGKTVRELTNSGDFDVYHNPNGLMTPTIIDEYPKDGQIFKRYIFLSDEHETYTLDYQSYNDWYNKYGIDSFTRVYNRSMVIMINKNDNLSITQFDQFLNLTLSEWRSNFSFVTELAKQGNFERFTLYDPRIYEYELSIEDRKSILNYMVYSLTWIIPYINGEKEKLLSSLVNNISNNHSVLLYDYMFTLDVSSQKTNLQLYKEHISDAAYSILMISLIKGFYNKIDLTLLNNNFMLTRLYPIGFSQKNYRTNYFNLETEEQSTLTVQMLGMKYSIDSTSTPFHIKINEAKKYIYNYGLKRIDYRSLPNHQNLSSDISINHPFDRILYITPFKIPNQIFKGFDIPVGCVLPIPAFALPWISGENEDVEGIEDLIRKYVNYAGLILPFFKIVQFAELVDIIALGMGVVGTILDEGVQNQIEMYDNYKTINNSNGEVCTSGRDFISIYYAISFVYGGIDLGKAIKEATNSKRVMILFEHEKLLTTWGFRDDFNDFIQNFHPEEDTQKFDEIALKMTQLQNDYNKYKFLKNEN